jgi:pSer/pThr/pTyr-binding forkhead associated (FHA) protein
VYLEYQGDCVELPVGETVVGRDVGCSMRLNDPSVSRRHLRLVRRAHEVFVEDLGSSNGTLVNNRTLAAPLRVVEGDKISVGTRELIVRVPSTDDSEAPPTLNLKNLADLHAESLRVRPTSRLPATVPPPMVGNQRCPRCAAVVAITDDECASCGYRWGQFRATAVTAETPNPLARRRFERHPVELHLIYVSSELEIEATTRDLSESGVFVCTEVLDPLGTSCQLTILVDGGPPIGVRGIVRRVVERPEMGRDPVGLGIEFTEVGAAERGWLRTIVARMAALASVGA